MSPYRHDGNMIEVSDWFCGAGGSSQGAEQVPNVKVTLAANHWQLALDTHQTNFPDVRHEQGKIQESPVHDWPVSHIHWASPECTKWSIANGEKRTFHRSRQDELFSREKTDKEITAEESRALMEQVPTYLEGVASRGRLVLAGVVENVTDEREWDGFDDWLRRFHRLGYKTRVIALNSMHAQPVRTLAAPQSRDRLYVGYWHRSLGRDPDWDKWLRPLTWCPACDEVVHAVLSFKKSYRDMGRYRSQYLYRCPRMSCRNTVVEPPVLPALEAIDLSLPTRRIGDGKPGKNFRPYAPNTVARIEAGVKKFWVPLLVPAGGTWNTTAYPVTQPLRTRTARENDALAVPPLLVPVEGRDGKAAFPATEPGRTQTARNETGVAFPPFLTLLRSGRPRNTDPAVDPLATIVADGSNHALVEPPPFLIPMRGGGDKERARPIDGPLHTVTAGGNHHYLAQAPEALLVPYYSNGVAKPASQPMGTVTTLDRFGLASADLPEIDINEVRFRMLEPSEIARGMAFAAGYVVLGDKRDQVTQLGNAVTPPAAEVLVSALVEAITGEELERFPGVAA
ncbi:DNA cytosine methyltransferase [Acrocarpospora phusangensis]|uniref:DNA (cytosine-5-)-methyltransferase n=1 Tax=Acrocarpospora phusangensis TaxID=1070424 RepID=A0A919QBZ1_9ACTN|nr:DNA cytosine methyltransferase [Acrocarpospora phusangensis]GIH26021.1 DNA cytosine methyltransferase [Acrocarpospora phusangensis]